MQMSRRTFMAASAAAVTALAPARALGANERVRVGVLGVRNRGNQVADSLNATGMCDVAVFCDCDRASYDTGMEKSGKNFATPPVFVQDFRRVLDDKDIDAVVVAAPDHWHGLMTVMALEAGKHVYVEKPASHNIRDGKAMVAAAQARPELVVQVGTQQRSGAHFQEARDFIKSGKLGTIGFVRTWITHRRATLTKVPDTAPPATMDYELWVGPAPFRPYNPEMCHYNWHFVRDYGTGEMGNWGAHWIDIARWCLDLDLPTAVTGMGGQYVVKDAKETPDTQTALYQFPGLTVLWEQRLWTNFKLNGEGSGVEFGGEEGSLVLSRGGWTFHPREGRPEKHGGTEIEGPHAVNFVESIQGKSKPAAPVVEGHKTAAMCHLANIAAQVNGRIEFDPSAQVIVNHPEAAALSGRDNRAPWPQFKA